MCLHKSKVVEEHKRTERIRYEALDAKRKVDEHAKKFALRRAMKQRKHDERKTASSDEKLEAADQYASSCDPEHDCDKCVYPVNDRRAEADHIDVVYNEVKVGGQCYNGAETHMHAAARKRRQIFTTCERACIVACHDEVQEKGLARSELKWTKIKALCESRGFPVNDNPTPALMTVVRRAKNF